MGATVSGNCDARKSLRWHSVPSITARNSSKAGTRHGDPGLLDAGDDSERPPALFAPNQQSKGGASMSNPEATGYEVGQDNIRPFGLDIHNPVFVVSALTIIACVLVTLAFQTEATAFFGWLRPFLTSNFDWFFLLSANIFVLFGFFLVVTPLGSVRLGGPDAKPDSSYFGWFSMLFAAGLGIGLMFFGVSEPMSNLPSSMCGPALDAGVHTDWAPPAAAARAAEAPRNPDT